MQQQATRVVSREIACRPQSAAQPAQPPQWRPWRRTGASRAAADQLAHAAASRATAAPWALGEQLHGTTATARRLSRSWPPSAHKRQLPSARSVAASSCCLQLRPEGAVPEAGPASMPGNAQRGKGRTNLVFSPQLRHMFTGRNHVNPAAAPMTSLSKGTNIVRRFAPFAIDWKASMYLMDTM